MSHYAKVKEQKDSTLAREPANKPNLNRFLGLALLAVLFIGAMAVLASVIWTPLKLTGTANVTVNDLPDHEVRYVGNWTVANLGDVIQGQGTMLKPVRITNISTQTGPVVVTVESTTDLDLSPLVFWSTGEDYVTPAILAPGEHVDLLVGVLTGAATPIGPISFKIVFS